LKNYNENIENIYELVKAKNWSAKFLLSSK